MNIYLEWLVTILWWICYPVGIVAYYLAIVLLTVAKLLYRPLALVLQPVVYFGRFILACLAFPFVLLAKLEVCTHCPTMRWSDYAVHCSRGLRVQSQLQ